MAVEPNNAETRTGFATPVKTDEYTDGRKLWEWQSKFPPEAQIEMKYEARILMTALVLTLVFAGFFLGLGDASFEFKVPIGDAPPTFYLSCKLLAFFLLGALAA